MQTQEVADVCEVSQVSSLERADLSVEISCLLVHVRNQFLVLSLNISVVQFNIPIAVAKSRL